MGFQLVFQVTFLLWLTKTLQVAAQGALPGCLDECGNVTIPYPFGINPGCYFNDRYAVDCRNGTPFIAGINLEVQEISLSGTVQVRSPVVSSCPGVEIRRFVDLGNSPFNFSESSNRFIAVGCNNLVVMTDLNHSAIAGCVSICDDEHRALNFSFSGINYCQTTIPPNLKFFNATSQKLYGKSDSSCTFAFLADKQWFNLSDPLPDKAMKYVPAVLNWALYNTTKTEILGVRIRNNTGAFCSETYDNSSETSIVRCFCKRGFQGNPYLTGGCADINECANAILNDCNRAGCINTEGYYICYNDDTIIDGINSKFQRKMIIIGVGTGVGVLFLLIGSWWLYKVVKKRNNMKRKEKFFKRNGGLLLQEKLSSTDGGVDQKMKLFDSKDLEKATDHYNENRILGRGGQGTVYKGMLSDGRIVAVKKSKMMDEEKVEQFINEVVILSQINHRNIVKVLGCCLETEFPLLVYEFISNGTLFQHIHDQNEEFPLSWEMRLRIAIEVAGALSYLHSASSIPIYHRDIKSTNILLDDKYRAKVADFGTSRSIAIDQTHVTTVVQGTFGYLDPEYFQSSQFTEKSDVYSFGVVILELLTGQKPISFTRSQGDRSLTTYFIQSMKENHLLEIIDPQILKEGGKEEIMAVAFLAKRCLNLSGRKRPTMKEVVVELEGVRMSQGGTIGEENYEGVEYNATELVGAWDAASTSTGSYFDSSIPSSLDVQPLLLNKS
ncbi:hypothetical protein F0562_005501 [Nyssa sinensis]|uniref:Protein kinase domain-containing protein n=1 Tax=Nyssa sinensis TaxID=561372 RepID=A0A5J5AII4_9ASTE|nr:hypothetical protein F0562_005501 [Nyssa sinensis]